MQFKIDTKENLVIIRLEESVLDAKMSDSFVSSLTSLPELEGKNLVLDLRSVQSADEAGRKAIFTVYDRQYGLKLSAAVANLQASIASQLSSEYPEMLNIVPTESEAIDMVMMEDMERELLGDE